MFNFIDDQDFITYQKMTEDNEELLKCFDDERENVNVSSKRWLKIFNNILHRSFKKVRICKNKNSTELDKLLEKREKFKKEKCSSILTPLKKWKPVCYVFVLPLEITYPRIIFYVIKLLSKLIQL